MAQFTTVTTRMLTLPLNDIDTDQIIPARFLKATDKNGMGDNLFADWRYNADGSPKTDFVLNKPESAGCQILLAGDNFGCGSSREHAPWALTGYGFRAVISTSFADIFRSNSLKNGLIPIIVDDATHKMLFDLAEEAPLVSLVIHHDGNESVLQRVVAEDIRKGGADDGAEAVPGERPGCVLAARAAAEVVTGQNNLTAH